MTFEERVAVLETVAIPIWLIDYRRQEMVWGNARALALWGAPDLADFCARDFKTVSPAVRTRQLTSQAIIEAGGADDRLLTFYPGDKAAVTARCHVSGFRLDDGRVLAMSQAFDTSVSIDPEQLRGIEAIRRIWAIVTLLDDAGAVLMQNPAGVRAFGATGTFHEWFVDELVARVIDSEVRADQIFRAEVLVRTLEGERWHAVEAHRSLDPVTGLPAMLLLQIDVTATRESRQMIARQAAQIRALSTPILDVGEGALALPLVGALDEERGLEIAGRLLPEVVARRAESVIVDLTGVDALDEAGAEALMKMVQAVRLLGARPILTGINPALAGMLVSRGADLSGLLTLRSLSAGLAVCRKRSSAGGEPKGT